MLNWLKNFWNGLTDILNDILAAVMVLLPDSPFANIQIPNEVRQILGYVNYFVPIGAMLAIGTGWLSAIGIYYLYQTILRWAKTIK